MCALQTLIRRKPVLYREVSLFKACKNLLLQSPVPLKPAASATASVINYLRPASGSASASASGVGCFKRYENPCLDLYFNVIPKTPVSESCALLNRLLPPAWSHNPLTTLKIIRNYNDRYYYETEVFAKAVYWLHHNHPKTLAFNLPYLVYGTHGHYYSLTIVLYKVLGLEDDVYPLYDHHVIDHFQTAIHTQPDFCFLHDRVSDFFAEGLKFGIQNLKNHDHDDEDAILEVTDASEFCMDAPFLVESVAKRVFPASTSVEEAVERLRKEVLEPLNKVLDKTDQFEMNPRGYRYLGFDWTKEPYFLWKKYLKEAKESSVDKMVAGALLPNQIVLFVDDGDLRQAVELQWKIMVEDLKKKQKETLSHSLVVIHPNKTLTSNNTGHAVAMSLTILMSELSVEEAWKGKFIPLIPKPRLVLIQGDDLKSKCQFLRKGVDTDEFAIDEYTDFKNVFDLILQEALDRSLKPDQMIKRLYVLTVKTHKDFTWISRNWVDEEDGGKEKQSKWQVEDYEETKSKYKEHGYDMPHIVFWRIGAHLEPVQQSPDERGIVTMSGLSCSPKIFLENDGNFVKMFLENDGKMIPQHIMEANIAHQDYDQSLLAVLD